MNNALKQLLHDRVHVCRVIIYQRHLCTYYFVRPCGRDSCLCFLVTRVQDDGTCLAHVVIFRLVLTVKKEQGVFFASDLVYLDRCST